MVRAIYADRFFMASGCTKPGYLTIIDGKFGSFSETKPENAAITDYSGHWIAPGLVDTHIHGIMNHDVMDNDDEGLLAMSEALLGCGVTSFLPTTLTADHDLLDEVVQRIGMMKDKTDGARIEGIFMEGPFFTEKYKGAQNPKYFSDPAIKALEKWQELSGGLVRKIAVAPEREGVADFVAYAVANGVAVALGHSDATYDEAKAAVDAGASIFVHTYNGMRPLTHREPGMVGAALTLENVFCEIICDGYHVHPAAAQLVVKAAGQGRTVLITDCMMAGAMPDGDYFLGEFPVIKKDGAVRMANGSLAGSALELVKAVKNVVDWGLVSPLEAIRMASEIPAKSAGIADCCGSIKTGRAADFIVLDKTLHLIETYMNGKLKYSAN